MGKATGFLEYKRENGPVIPEEERVKDFKEFHERLSLEEQQKQGARCMDCGVPFCQAGCMLAGMMSGCPLHNLVPEL
ncbi:MAG: glutamate synthase, partial [Lachnospiraceae bacterium]|nr:glutamate synthase [Lachnospiraceae bacterium]